MQRLRSVTSGKDSREASIRVIIYDTSVKDRPCLTLSKFQSQNITEIDSILIQEHQTPMRTPPCLHFDIALSGVLRSTILLIETSVGLHQTLQLETKFTTGKDSRHVIPTLNLTLHS